MLKFWIGFMLGGNFGFVLMALLKVGKMSERND